MPYATNNGANLYWEEHGAGDPVLMIMGLSFSLDMWHRTIPVISSTHRAAGKRALILSERISSPADWTCVGRNDSNTKKMPKSEAPLETRLSAPPAVIC